MGTGDKRLRIQIGPPCAPPSAPNPSPIRVPAPAPCPSAQVAHTLNKPIESICGYLTVLPGAFSAFRWAAVEGEPLRRYFYGLYSQNDLSAFEANMYLAEDRVLCLEIVARKNSKY